MKRLQCRYAFVLTGTPIENRIDELYSIVEFLDPQLFGPLFRFNREFYELDERGRPIGYRNLDELRSRLAPVHAAAAQGRRRDASCPTVRHQLLRDDGAKSSAPATRSTRPRLPGCWRSRERRPLDREEFERLQQWLACMRMICDTPHPRS